MYSEFTAGNAENYLRLLTALSHINVRLQACAARGASLCKPLLGGDSPHQPRFLQWVFKLREFMPMNLQQAS